MCRWIYSTHISRYTYIYIASQIVTDLGKEAVGWKLGKGSAKFMSQMSCFFSSSRGGGGWAARFLLSCLLGFCIHIVSGLDPPDIGLIVNSYPIVPNSSLRSSHPPHSTTLKEPKSRPLSQQPNLKLQPSPLDLQWFLTLNRRVDFFFYVSWSWLILILVSPLPPAIPQSSHPNPWGRVLLVFGCILYFLSWLNQPWFSSF